MEWLLLEWIYFSLSSEMLSRTSSYMWGRWYLGYVLVEGWILHPYVYCFFDSSDQVLVLPPLNAEVVNGGTMTSDGKMVIYWGGAFRCSLNLSPKVLDDSPVYSSSQSILLHFYLYMMPLFFVMGSLSLAVIRRLLMALPPLQYTFTPCFLHTFFMSSLSSFTYDTTIWGLGLLNEHPI